MYYVLLLKLINTVSTTMMQFAFHGKIDTLCEGQFFANI